MGESVPTVKDSGSSQVTGMGSIFLTVFLDLVGFSIIFPLLPSLLQWYLPREGEGSIIGRFESLLAGISPASSGDSSSVLTLVLFGGALGSIFSILQFVASPIWGRLSDRFGRRNILLFTTSGTCVSYLIWMFSGSFIVYVIGRVICGLMAGNISVATAAIADVTGRGNRTRGMAIVGISFALGFMIGPAIGGAASLIDFTRIWPESVRYGINPFSGAALISVILSLVNLVWISKKFPETLAPENRTKHTISFNPFSNLQMEKGPARSVIFADFVFTMIFSGMEFTITFLALERLGFGPKENIAIFVFAGVVMTLVQGLFTNKLAARFKNRERKLACAGIVLGLCGMFTLALSSTLAVFFFGLFLKAFGVALVAPTLTSLVSLYTLPTKQGSTMGTFRAMGSLGRATGPIFASIMYWAMGSRLTYLAGTILMGIPLYMALRLRDPLPDTSHN